MNLIYAIGLSLFLILYISCKPDLKESIDYCERLKADQSNLVKKDMSASKKENRFKKRKAEFRKNWQILENLMEKDQLHPEEKDSCFTNFVIATLIHNVQQYPETIFNKDTVDDLTGELKKGNVTHNHLETVLKFYKDFTVDEKRCIHMKEKVDYAIKVWKIKENAKDKTSRIDDIVYIDCLSNR